VFTAGSGELDTFAHFSLMDPEESHFIASHNLQDNTETLILGSDENPMYPTFVESSDNLDTNAGIFLSSYVSILTAVI
jgi:hypothetical protein